MFGRILMQKPLILDEYTNPKMIDLRMTNSVPRMNARIVNNRDIELGGSRR